MIKDLKEAIAHAREVAEEQRKKAERNIIETTKEGWIRVYDGKEYNACLECAREHEQLGFWLEELAERREAVNRLEEVAKDYKDSLFGDGIRFALKIIGEPRKRDWESEATNE